MPGSEYTRRGLSRKAARNVVALVLLSLTVVVPATLVAAAPGARADAHAHASGSCSGTITVQIAGKEQTASHIKTMNVSCETGKSVLHSFLRKAAAHSGCRIAAGRPAPTRGCLVSGYHCFLKRTPDYCATVSGREVEWRLRPATARG
jgi:hypothetical protein